MIIFYRLPGRTLPTLTRWFIPMTGLIPQIIKVRLNVTCSIIFESFIFEIYLEVFPPGSLSPHWEVESAPDLSIDYEKLKIQEKILFFDEVY